MAERTGNTSDGSEQHLELVSSAFTANANVEAQSAVNELPDTKPLETPNNGGTGDVAVKGKHYDKNQRKKQNRKIALSGENSSGELARSLLPSLRLQIRLEKGIFTNALKDELLRDLNILLYQTAANSFIPTFFGFGLRYGKIWFSPENQESHDWLKQSLLAINEKVPIDFRFIIEPFNLHMNSICLSVPWNTNENLNQNDILNRIVFQNPNLLANFWRINKVIPTEKGHRLFFFSISNDSLDILKTQKFSVNYGFQKVLARVLSENKFRKNL